MQQPTAPALEIFKRFWEKPSLMAPALHDGLSNVLGWGYSSTAKTLEQLLADLAAARQGG